MPRDKDPASLEAWTLHHSGDNEEAIEKFNLLVASNPDNADALNGLALTQKALGDHLGARVTLKKLIALLERQSGEDEQSRSRLVMELRMAKQQIEMLDI